MKSIKNIIAAVRRSLRNEEGIETLEWIAVGALITGVAMAVYPGVLQTALTTVVGDISTALTGILT